MNGRLHEDALRQKLADARKASSADQMVADADQSASDADQLSSNADQTGSDRDQTGADRDQRASDVDQATADRDLAEHGDLAPADEKAYESSREDREQASFERLGDRLHRHATGRDRDEAATEVTGWRRSATRGAGAGRPPPPAWRSRRPNGRRSC